MILSIFLQVLGDLTGNGMVAGGVGGAAGIAASLITIRVNQAHEKEKRIEQGRNIVAVTDTVNRHLIKHAENLAAETELKTDVKWIKKTLEDINDTLKGR